ncbi:MAG: hypothetical protein KJ623_04595 [Nanoarchaeota archaeon]|nr:hypothetical protein [Nanoarchaeota archaeon]MBU0962607.1 hypothetical protein [Nanoarchaeota archaeon]
MIGLEGKVEADKMPWELDKSKINIINEYDAKIVSDEGDRYGIEFYDYDSSLVESTLPKSRFNKLPHEAGIGTHFWIVCYNIKGKEEILSVCVWPVAEYWHESW